MHSLLKAILLSTRIARLIPLSVDILTEFPQNKYMRENDFLVVS
jgi:hypothetical protein